MASRPGVVGQVKECGIDPRSQQKLLGASKGERHRDEMRSLKQSAGTLWEISRREKDGTWCQFRQGR